MLCGQIILKNYFKNTYSLAPPRVATWRSTSLCNGTSNPDSSPLRGFDRKSRRNSTASWGSARYIHPAVLGSSCPQDTSRRSTVPVAVQNNPGRLSRRRVRTQRRWTLSFGSVRSTSWKKIELMNVEFLRKSPYVPFSIFILTAVYLALISPRTLTWF